MPSLTRDENQERIIGFLRKVKAAPQSEIEAVTSVEGDAFKSAIDELQTEGLINVSDDIIVARGKLLRGL